MRTDRVLHPTFRVGSVVLVLLLASAPLVAAGPTGVWSLELDFQGQKVPVELQIWEADGGLAGSWKGPRGTTELDQITFADGTLRFSRSFSGQGQSFDLEFSGTIDGDSLQGSFDSPRGSLPVSGKRTGDATAAAAGPSSAEAEAKPEVAASELPSAEAQEFLGNWALEANIQGNEIQVDLVVGDKEGKLTAFLASPQGEQNITDITRTEDGGLKFAFESGFGPLQLVARIDADALQGTFGSADGSFSAPITGSRSTVARDSDAARARRARMRAGRPMTLLTLADKEVKVYYADPEVESDEYGQIASAAPGEVLEFTRHAAIKLLTDLDLRFGETEVPYGNISANYPGVYSLWLKRADEGWHLVFNHQGDVWGTMHEDEADVGEVPLEHATAAEPVEKLTAELQGSDDGAGELTFSWGEHRWSTTFRAAQ